jgi:methyl-accepting chemotaxis protein
MSIAAKFSFRLSSIKIILFGALGILILLSVGSLSTKVAGSWSAYSSGIKMRLFDQSANRYISGLFEVLLERGATGNALQAPAPADAAAIAEINQHRNAMKESFEVGLAEFKASDFPNKQTLLGDLNDALEKAADYRRRADAAMLLAKDARDEELRKNFIPVLTASVDAALKVWFSALYAAAKFDPALTRFAAIKEIGWRMRDIAGLERSTIGSAISAGVPLTPDRLAAIAIIRARVDSLWDQLVNLTLDPETPPPVAEAVAKAREDYFKTFRKLADDMRSAGEAAGQYPMTAQQWTDTTTPLLGALLAVLSGAGAASESHASGLIGRATYDLAVSSGLLLLSLLVMAAVIFVVSRRVTGPLAELQAVMGVLASGDTTVDVPGRGRRDEIGEMANAVELFKTNAIERVRLEAEQREAAARTAAEKQSAEQREIAEKKAAAEREEATRKATMRRLANQFETAVGTIIESVASASTELEAAAATLTQTADTTQRLSTTVASASEQASANVQSVASATEEMSRRSARSAGRFRSRARSRSRRSNRPKRPMAALASCRRLQVASATW